jgi:hypothetical protein
MKNALTAEKGGYWDRWKEKNFSASLATFLPCMSDIASCRIGLCFMALHVLCSIIRSSLSINSIGCLEWKRSFTNSNVKDDIAYQGKDFQIESILGVIGDDILLDNRTRWVHKSTGEIMMTWLESGPTPYRVLAQNQRYTSSDWQMVDVCKTAMKWLDDTFEPRGTLGWEWTICKH